MLLKLLHDLEIYKNPNKALILQWFFKTWIWQYWEWDIFIWIQVPILRTLSKKYKDLSYDDIEYLLNSKIHEQRFLALSILRYNYEKTKDISIKTDIFTFTLTHISSINNWDLVDTFIPYTFWEYFFLKDKDFLYQLALSPNIWERRISIMTTFYFIKNNVFEDTIKICTVLLQDKHDLIHKATWWMLREIWKREIQKLYNFLDKHYKIMPRVMLRYAIEKIPKDKKIFYMKR